VAYTLANIDSNRELIESMPERRPMRPYFWTLLHGGGGGWRWWKGQPLANEEKRAMIAMAFFAGIDGIDTWNWSGTGNHHVPPPLTRLTQSDDYFASGRDVMLERGFLGVPKSAPDGAPTEQFQRYDVLHVLDVDTEKGLAEFQKIRHSAKNHGVADDQPVFTMPIEQLESHLRIKSEPVAAMIEGMALVKPLEYTLRHGVVKVDIPARDQFTHTLPIVRRIKIGPIHVLCTYDPKVIYGGEPREIVLSDFDGCPGRTLKIPADSETRIFVMREEVPSKSGRPPISRIQFGSCIRENRPMAILEKMADRQPDLLIFLGGGPLAGVVRSSRFTNLLDSDNVQKRNQHESCISVMLGKGIRNAYNDGA
jgi:hypothetical protein